MNARPFPESSLVWDVSAMSGLTLDAVAALVLTGAPFVLEVDPYRCSVMWGPAWSRIEATPMRSSLGPAWRVRSLPLPSSLPSCGGTAAAGPVGPDQPTTAPALTPRLLLPSSLILSRALPFSDVPPPGPERSALALGTEKHIASPGPLR